MIVLKKNADQFYTEMRTCFSEIDEHSMWKEYDYVQDSFSNAIIFSSIAEFVVEWMRNGEVEKVEKILNFIKNAYIDYASDLICYVYTDFLPTIISDSDVKVREQIKKLMPVRMQRDYDQLIAFGFYSES